MTVGITELPPEGMQLGGVALAGDAERGTKTTEGLSLLFTAAGITVQGPQPQIERLLVWSGLDSATCREKVTLPDGRSAAVMELTSGGQSIRFLFPTETVTPGQAAYLDQALPHWLARYKGAPAAPSGGNNGAGASITSTAPPPPPSPGAPAVGTAAGMAAAASVAGEGRGPQAEPPSPPPPSAAPRSAPPTAGPPGSGPLPAPPAPPGWANAGSVGSPPPPPPPPPGGVSGYAAPPQVNVPPPPAPLSVGTPGWETAVDPQPGGTAWDSPPSTSGPDFFVPSPEKKTRRRRKGGASDEAAALGATAASGAFAPPVAPSEPPTNPVPLQGSTLPPPPPGATPTDSGPVVWKPPVDPVTGQTLWDGQPVTDVPPPAETGSRRGLGRRRAAKASAAGAVAGTAAGVGAEAMAGSATTAPPMGGAPPLADPSNAFLPGAAPAPFGAEAEPPPPFTPVLTSDADLPPEKKKSRTTLVLLVVLVLVVIGGVTYFLLKKNNNNSTTTASTAAPAPAPLTGDTALAASINLRLSDLPTGWAVATPGGAVRPPVAPAAAQVQATRGLSQCLGVPYATAAGLFATSPIPGQTGSATSPIFADGSDATIRMFSSTRVMANTAAVQSLASPFANTSFLTCFGEYQSVLASAATPGATAQVQVVGLAAPTGVQAYGYLTTITIPNQGTDIEGEAFLFGGRIESKLEPTTGGAQVPTSAFTPALNGMESRIAASVNK